MKKIAINGFGRIERFLLKVILETPGLAGVAMNELMSIENAGEIMVNSLTDAI